MTPHAPASRGACRAVPGTSAARRSRRMAGSSPFATCPGRAVSSPSPFAGARDGALRRAGGITAPWSPRVPGHDRRCRARRARRAPRARQPLDAQGADGPALGREAAAVSPSLHADQFVVDQHGRALVRAAHRAPASSRCTPKRLALEAAIKQYIAVTNEEPKPLIWKTRGVSGRGSCVCRPSATGVGWADQVVSARRQARPPRGAPRGARRRERRARPRR
jgi:hypothetical protein